MGYFGGHGKPMGLCEISKPALQYLQMAELLQSQNPLAAEQLPWFPPASEVVIRIVISVYKATVSLLL